MRWPLGFLPPPAGSTVTNTESISLTRRGLSTFKAQRRCALSSTYRKPRLLTYPDFHRHGRGLIFGTLLGYLCQFGLGIRQQLLLVLRVREQLRVARSFLAALNPKLIGRLCIVVRRLDRGLKLLTKTLQVLLLRIGGLLLSRCLLLFR